MLLWSKKVDGVGAEVVGVEHPSAEGDGDAELMFFIALAVERNESQACWRSQTGSAGRKR